ncbi:DNA polymerase exonuclease subunit [Pseudomonas phage Cassandra]|nr:DNA polymerase exonuclease subunit [Pseudomonas phage Cassandra]
MTPRLKELLESLIILDTETTHLDTRVAEIIELGIASYTNKWTYSSELFKPRVNHAQITPKISSITGITDRMVEGKPTFADVVDQYKSITNCQLIVAHNAPYDKKVLERYDIASSTNWLCTLKLARYAYQTDPTFEEFKLSYLRYKLMLDIPDDFVAHRAGEDAYMCGVLLERIVTDLESKNKLDSDIPYADQLIEISNKPLMLSSMPFGKHKDKPLDEVPMDYWIWALNNLDALDETKPEYNRDLAYTLEQYLSDKI